MDYYELEAAEEELYYLDEPEYTLADLYANCLRPALKDGIRAAAVLLPSCLLYRLLASSKIMPKKAVHIVSALAGLCCLYDFFGVLLGYVAGFVAFGTAVLILADVLLSRCRGIVCSLAIVSFLVVCEMFLVDAASWQKVRGSQMIIAMKVISVALDVDRGLYSLPSISGTLGYLLHVGTCVFGPWISFLDYLGSVEAVELDVIWGLSAIRSFLLSYMSLTVSTCWAGWFLPVADLKWPAAYRDALAFRFSHYFISFLSETSAVVAGVSRDGSWDLSISSPKDVEVPRSLVCVVIHWNRSMHTWLKHYVFRPVHPCGTFAAILVTYAASSLLHGLNFQLAAVLLSLGFYTYTEHVLRHKLATVFEACVAAKKCKPNCGHKYKSDQPMVFAVNLLFGLLTVFHLAYLGVMFDAPTDLQEQGYSMWHTLSKWSELHFASHWVAACTFLFYLVT
ncbi:protein-serine O-palmitoleoyltransferase porcupine-like [Ornithodoros turicata]